MADLLLAFILEQLAESSQTAFSQLELGVGGPDAIIGESEVSSLECHFI